LFYRFGNAPHSCYLAVDIADGAVATLLASN
jgi:hypothetical protein